jgi:thiamine phosphate synthase YjbQ (UPF0047 family)
MKSFTDYLVMETKERYEILDITNEVERIVRDSKIAEGNGKLDLGPWERVHYGEFDGRRRKRIVVKVMGE